MTIKSRNKYGRGNLQLLPPDKVYIPKIKANDEISYLNLAEYIILLGLIKGDRNQREHILNSIKSCEVDYFSVKLFPYFLFQTITRWLAEDIDRQITPEMFLDQIFDFFPIVWGYQAKWPEIRDEVHVCSQFYYIEFTTEDIEQAINVRKKNPRVSVEEYLHRIKEKSE